MPDCGPAEVAFTLLVGTFTLALTLLTLRESFLRWKGR